jgi:hypothetical protein
LLKKYLPNASYRIPGGQLVTAIRRFADRDQAKLSEKKILPSFEGAFLLTDRVAISKTLRN